MASLIVFTLFIGVLLYFWYPEPYFTASGGWQGLKIMALIDLVLGPLLTFILFNTKKSIKDLRLDFSLIVLLQVSALVWGIYTVYNQRPIATVFWENSFFTVPFNAVKEQYKNSPQLAQIVDQPRQLYFVARQTSSANSLKLREEILSKQLPPYQLINRYESIKPHFENIKKFSIDIAEVVNNNSRMKASLTAILIETKTQIDDNFYIPLVSRYQNIILVFSKTGQQLGYLKSPYKN